MMKTPHAYRGRVILAVILTCLFPLFSAAAQEPSRAFYDVLQRRLIADGFDAERIKRLYHSDAVFFEARGVTAYFQHNEAALDYDKLTKRSYIVEGKAYMRRHADVLARAEKCFGVDPRVITAIILVETRFGTVVGKRSIINTLSTMAVLAEAQPREYLWEQLPSERRFSRTDYDRKADQKADWAYKELKAFLTYTDLHGIDAPTVVGSYAGALGIAQFMPSNILVYGRDGDGDGRIDLFTDADAIFSIANYLKNYGWKPGLDREKAFKAVYHYNHSKYYVNTILKIVDLLEG
ncbi:MAG: protein MltB [Desulfobacteraceae bacterium]|nr:MAG: protein MltB [Desulfobacteraceae bacterium]